MDLLSRTGASGIGQAIGDNSCRKSVLVAPYAEFGRVEECYNAGKTFVIFATASLIGEGFDRPRLDTLILSMPLSFKARLIQYAGRLNRVHESKNAPLIFDYLDGNHALTNAMFRRRLAGYRELGYQVDMPQDVAPAWFEVEVGNAK